MTDQEQIAALQAVIAEIERRLTLGEGYADGDRIRFALLHIEAHREGRANPLALRDREQIAALQAQLDAIRDKVRYIHWGDMHALGTAILQQIASAPSDVLDRVKREAKAEALEEAALIARTQSRHILDRAAFAADLIEDKAAAIRTEARA